MTERIHWSSRPITRLREVAQDQFDYKPRGLWYELGGGWALWCASEAPSWIKGKSRYRVHLGRARILRLRTLAAIDDFAQRYCIPFPWQNAAARLRIGTPDWPRLATEYDGLEIAPYQWQRRHEYIWYYGWDCASGVIWRPSPTTRVELMR